VAGVLTIGFIFGAYWPRCFRGAFLAVPPGQREAALAFGITPWQVLTRIVGPQMLRHALPGLSNNWLVMIKSTAIVSVIGLSDLMNRAAQAAGNTKRALPVLRRGGAASTWPSRRCRSWALPGCARLLDRHPRGQR
jgi:arginine/ornithine transport system permease protein